MTKHKWILVTAAVWLVLIGGTIALAVSTFQKPLAGNTVTIPTPTPTPTPAPPTAQSITFSGPVTLSPTNPTGYVTATNSSAYPVSVETITTTTDLPASVGYVTVSGGPIPALGNAQITVTYVPAASPPPGTYNFTIYFNLTG